MQDGQRDENIKHKRTDISHRRCQCCGEVKPASDFSRDKHWIRRDCKSCRARREKVRYNQDETATDPRLNAWFSGKWRINQEEPI